MSIGVIRIFVAMCVCMVSVPTWASVLTLNHSIEFSGATPPAGSTPWQTAEFDDGGTPGSVTLTLDTAGLVGTEYVSSWYFNLDPSLDPTDLVFSAPDVTKGSLEVKDIELATNDFKADGDGKYDILIEFSTSNAGGGAKRFTADEEVEFTITGIASLTADSFNFLSFPDGGNGPFVVASHVQGIGAGGNDSGWTTVPEPASLVLLACAAAALSPRRRRIH